LKCKPDRDRLSGVIAIAGYFPQIDYLPVFKLNAIAVEIAILIATFAQI